MLHRTSKKDLNHYKKTQFLLAFLCFRFLGGIFEQKKHPNLPFDRGQMIKIDLFGWKCYHTHLTVQTLIFIPN